jgi:predicted phage baseplate assembly protein
MGEVLFGDGITGMIPPIGRDNIKTNYKSGGGVNGNVAKAEIKILKTSVASIDHVINPEPAEGGADTELVEAVFERGPHLIKHRDRAVTEEDFERLAKAASSYIARTRCFTEGNKLKILLIPKGEEDKPTPSCQNP